MLTIEEVRGMVAAMPESLYFVDMAETIYEGLCAMTGTEWEDRTGPDLIARLPENEDGSDPRWKLLEHAPSLARLCLSLSAQLQQEREARERVEQAAREVVAAKDGITDAWKVLKASRHDAGRVNREVMAPAAQCQREAIDALRAALAPQEAQAQAGEAL